MKPIPTILSPKEEKPNFMPICNESEFFMELKDIKQNIALEEVSPTAEIFLEIDQSLEEFKGVLHDKLLKILPPMKDIQHHSTLILHGFEDCSCKRRVPRMTV